MREFDLLKDYPSPKNSRKVGKSLRKIEHRIAASYRDKELYDGDRNHGYGGFNYDGRWKQIVKFMCEEYELNNNSCFLQLACEKGFLLNDLKEYRPGMEIHGVELSNYAVNNSMQSVKKFIKNSSYLNLNFEDNQFDFVLAIGVVYAFNLTECIKSLKEIQRVSKGNSFITLASYENEDDYWLFKNWTLLGNLILKKDEWIEILKHTGYSGDYKFTNAKSLNLIKED